MSERHKNLQNQFHQELSQPGVLCCFADVSLKDLEIMLKVSWSKLCKITGRSVRDSVWDFDALCRGDHAWLTWDTVHDLRQELKKSCSVRLKRLLYRAQVIAWENRKLFDASPIWLYAETDYKPNMTDEEKKELWKEPAPKPKPIKKRGWGHVSLLRKGNYM